MNIWKNILRGIPQLMFYKVRNFEMKKENICRLSRSTVLDGNIDLKIQMLSRNFVCPE